MAETEIAGSAEPERGRQPGGEPSGAIPPQVMKEQMRGLTLRRQDYGLLPGANQRLPVLEAFQDFIEVERRKTRQRMVLMAGSFLLLLLALVGAALLSGTYAFRTLDGNVENLRGDLEAARARATAEGEVVRRQVESLSAEAVSLQRDMEGARGELRRIRGEVAAAATNQATDTVELQKLLALMEQQDREFREALGSLTARVEAVSAALAQAPALNGPDEPIPPAPERKETPSAPGERFASISVSRPGTTNSVTLRLPLPE